MHRVCRALMQAADILTVMRELSSAMQQSAHVQYALRVHAALTTGDYVGFVRLHAGGTCSQQALLQQRIEQVGLPHIQLSL